MELLTDCDPLSERDKIIQSLRTEKWACTKPCFYLSAEKKKTNPRQKNWGISVFHWWSRRTWEHQGRPEDFVSVLIYWCWKFEGDGPTALACPAQKDPQIQFFYSEEYFMQLDIHSFLASSSFLSLLLPLAYVNNLFLNKTRTKTKKSHPSSDFQFSRVKEYNTYADSTQRRAWNIARLTKKSYSSTTGNSWDFPWLVTVESLDQLLWKLSSSSSYTWVHQPPKNI